MVSQHIRGLNMRARNSSLVSNLEIADYVSDIVKA